MTSKKDIRFKMKKAKKTNKEVFIQQIRLFMFKGFKP